jgi:hypothetical protein
LYLIVTSEPSHLTDEMSGEAWKMGIEPVRILSREWRQNNEPSQAVVLSIGYDFRDMRCDLGVACSKSAPGLGDGTGVADKVREHGTNDDGGILECE